MKKEENKLVKEVIEDFNKRAMARKSFDNIWKMNMNFLMGNQFCSVGYNGVEESEKQFFWQEREVFNHIAPIFDIRYSKLSNNLPDISIIPASSDEKDKNSAKVCKKIYQSVKEKLNINALTNKAIKWAEVCGTVFYKIGWNNFKGALVGKDDKGREIRSGEVEVSVVSPFEIYPDSSVAESLDECQSIIHAKAYKTSQIKSMYGIEVEGRTVNTFSLDSITESIGGLGYNGTAPKIIESRKSDSAIVIERYSRPSVEYPEGRLTIVAGDRLVYDGALPYKLGADGERDFPFIRQTCTEEPGCFWGTSIIERLIPVQRAYNAIKNRKHEFVNRLSMGVLSVEDGSVDLDNLEDEGLCPGKVLVYRQGSIAPKFLEGESLPTGIDDEEQKLLEEFTNISGVSETLGTDYASANISGVALELMISQDEARLNATSESIKQANTQLAKFILKLYKQFALFPRLAKIVGQSGGVEMFYFSSSDITSDDITLSAQSDNLSSPAQKREMVFRLLENGILENEEGKLTNRMKTKILEMLGMGVWENAQDLNELHIKKAGNENLKMLDGVSCKVMEIDDHKLHINEHIAFMLGQDYENARIKNEKLEEIYLEHIRAHKKYIGG